VALSAQEGAEQGMARGSAPGKLHAAEGAAEDHSLFHRQDDEAEAIERVWHVFAPIGQVDRRGGTVRDGAQLPRQVRIQILQHRGCASHVAVRVSGH
jgi:hypothetical protein